MIGRGWSFNMPTIEHINRTGSDQLYATDYYFSTMDGELASTTVLSTYGARFEAGNFNKYKFSTSTNSWIVTDKNGTTYKFGSVAASRQDDPNNSSHIYSDGREI